MFERLRARNEWKFFSVLPKASGTLAILWWIVIVLRGVLPALFAIAMGVLVAAVERGDRLTEGLALVGIVFVLLQILTPIHQAIGATSATVPPPGSTIG